jgi:hypothetical protein
MPSYSITNGDMSREVRQENYDGTATITYTDPEGFVTEEVVPSDEQAPVVELDPIDPVVVEDFATSIIEADSLQEMRDAAQALLDALGGA